MPALWSKQLVISMTLTPSNPSHHDPASGEIQADAKILQHPRAPARARRFSGVGQQSVRKPAGEAGSASFEDEVERNEQRESRDTGQEDVCGS